MNCQIGFACLYVQVYRCFEFFFTEKSLKSASVMDVLFFLKNPFSAWLFLHLITVLQGYIDFWITILLGLYTILHVSFNLLVHSGFKKVQSVKKFVVNKYA